MHTVIFAWIAAMSPSGCESYDRVSEVSIMLVSQTCMLNVWENRLFFYFKLAGRFVTSTYMVKNRFRSIPMDVNCVASPVGSKSYMQWLHSQKKDKKFSDFDQRKIQQSFVLYMHPIYTWWISPMKWERKSKPSVRLSVCTSSVLFIRSLNLRRICKA